MKSTRSSHRSNKSQTVNVDEEGFTDQRCRNCQMRLSLKEIQAFSNPTASEDLNKTHQTFANTMKSGILCLYCYAMIVDIRSKNRRNVDKAQMDVAVNADFIKTPIITPRVSRAISVKSERVKVHDVVEKKMKKKDEDVMKKQQRFNKTKTDITLFANATFNAGVFSNTVPGFSI